MLPLLAYKIFRYKSVQSKSLSNKSVTENQKKTILKRQCKCNKHKNFQTIFELFIILFGIFGVPLSFIVYSNTSKWYPLKILHETSKAEHVVDYSFSFESVSLSFQYIISKRQESKRKYSFNHSWTSIDRRSGLSMEEFLDMYSGKWPVIISDCGNKWPAFKKWNKSFFLNNYGNELVTVKTYSDGIHETFAMPLSLYLNHIDEAYPHQWTYLNDEMFIPSRPNLEMDLGTCKELNEDFFKLFPIEVRPWWSFLLWGSRFSRSDLHIDPFNWTGTNMVISGLKSWKLFPPGQDHLLHVIPKQQYKFPINFNKYNSHVDCYNNSHLQKFPSVRQAKVIEFYQYPGELLIIPSGWFHQAFNVEPTVAVAGQIMNSDNYIYILEELFKGGEVPRHAYSSAILGMAKRDQVIEVLSRISNTTIRKGRETTLMMYDQLKELAKSSGLPKPPLLFDRL